MHIRKCIQTLTQRGDTIVEVLIAITVISAVLGGAYATTSHSLQSTRDAQERSQALKLVQSQIEQLKNIAVSNPNEIFSPSAPSSFCIPGVGGSTTVVLPGDAKCTVDRLGAQTSTQPAYHLVVTKTASTTTNGYDFTATATWERVSGGAQDQLQTKYRLYRP